MTTTTTIAASDLAYLGHGLGDELTNLLVASSRNGGDVPNVIVVPDRGGKGLELFDKGTDGLINASGDLDGVGTSRNHLHALSDEGSGKDGGSGGSVTSKIVGVSGSLTDEFCADVLDGVLELDLTGDGDTVVHDLGGAVLGLEDDVTTLGSKGDTDDGGELVHTNLHFLESLTVLVEVELLGCLHLDGATGATGQGGLLALNSLAANHLSAENNRQGEEGRGCSRRGRKTHRFGTIRTYI